MKGYLGYLPRRKWATTEMSNSIEPLEMQVSVCEYLHLYVPTLFRLHPRRGGVTGLQDKLRGAMV